MLFNLTYKDNNVNKQLTVSAESMANVIVYCDSNDYIPTSISTIGNNLILNQPSLTYCYNVLLQDASQNPNTHIIYDTIENVISWITSQTGQTLQSMNKADKAFVVA